MSPHVLGPLPGTRPSPLGGDDPGAPGSEVLDSAPARPGPPDALQLDQSFAYSDSFSDYAMLAMVGRPTAVNPDVRLRSIARAYHWPVLDLR